ncbi:MAG: hypothetical protein JWP46_1131 [Modestobacter sp.]|nr:hypothetical protein [Modestobacter sp.]
MEQPRVIGERIHLDLLDAGRAARRDSPPGSTRYVDVADRNVHALLTAGDGSGCPATDEAAHPPPSCCLTGDVVVDLAGGGQPRHLFVVLFPVPPDEQAEFDDWFGSEHGPLLAAAGGWARARLVALDGGPVTRLAVHDIEDLDVLDGPDRQRAGGTAWTTRLFRRNWATSVRRHVLAAG